MSAGPVLPKTNRVETNQPQLKLPFALRGTEPIFDYLIKTAERTFQVAEQQLEEMRAIRKALEERRI